MATATAASVAPLTPGLVQRTCLNGWWDFQSAVGHEQPSAVPVSGWSKEAYLVPSFWTKPRDAIRQPGETYFRSGRKTCEHHDGDENLFDAWGYPVAWSG